MLFVKPYPFQRGDRIYTSESDVKDGPRTEQIKKIIMAVYPIHM